MSQVKLQSLQTVIFGSIKSGSNGSNKPKVLPNGNLAFSVPVYSGKKDEATGKREFTQYIQIYVSPKFKTSRMIAQNTCDKDIFLKFEGFIGSSAYIDKSGKAQSQLTLNCFDIEIIKDNSESVTEDDTSFDPQEFASEDAAGFTTPPQL